MHATFRDAIDTAFCFVRLAGGHGKWIVPVYHNLVESGFEIRDIEFDSVAQSPAWVVRAGKWCIEVDETGYENNGFHIYLFHNGLKIFGSSYWGDRDQHGYEYSEAAVMDCEGFVDYAFAETNRFFRARRYNDNSNYDPYDPSWLSDYNSGDMHS